MLPPVDPNVLSANPKFEALYRDLTTNKLNEDGTSKLTAKAQKERESFASVSRDLGALVGAMEGIAPIVLR